MWNHEEKAMILKCSICQIRCTSLALYLSECICAPPKRYPEIWEFYWGWSSWEISRVKGNLERGEDGFKPSHEPCSIFYITMGLSTGFSVERDFACGIGCDDCLGHSHTLSGRFGRTKYTIHNHSPIASNNFALYSYIMRSYLKLWESGCIDCVLVMPTLIDI